METKFLLEIVFRDGEKCRKHYPSAAAAAIVMDALADWDPMTVKSVTLTAVRVMTLREMAGA